MLKNTKMNGVSKELKVRKNFNCCKKQVDTTRYFYDEAERTRQPKCMGKGENRGPEKSNGHSRSDSHVKLSLYPESTQNG